MIRWLKLAVVLIAAVVLIQGLGDAANPKKPAKPGLSPYATELKAANSDYMGMKATFLGVATVLFDDGESAIMVDGFFTRPGKKSLVFGKIAPNPAIIDSALERAGVKKLKAVLVSHSHYDHAMDCAEVAKRTDAVLVGSESTANIGRGAGLGEERMRVVKVGETYEFGRFKITFLPSKHAPTVFEGGEITKPLVPPARAIDYREGESYAILIEHDGKGILVQSTAGWVDGALDGKKADVVFLGIGRLGKTNPKYQEQYWRETVEAVGAKRVIPIHWDDFTISLNEPLKLAPEPFDNIENAMTFVREKGKKGTVDVRFPTVWIKFDPFESL